MDTGYIDYLFLSSCMEKLAVGENKLSFQVKQISNLR